MPKCIEEWTEFNIMKETAYHKPSSRQHGEKGLWNGEIIKAVTRISRVAL